MSAFYDRLGVPEYWIVDLDEHAVEQFVLRDHKFVFEGSHSESITVATIENVCVDLKKVW